MTQVTATYTTENSEMEVVFTGWLEFTSDDPDEGDVVDVKVDDVVIFGKSVDWKAMGLDKELLELTYDLDFEE